METALLEKIQEARRNPMQAMKDIGIDPDSVLGCEPMLEAVFADGLPAAELDDRLFSAAESHALDMVRGQYFSKISLDGLSPGERFESWSYFAEKAGEVHGVLLFRNYLPKTTAVEALYKNILSNDLSCPSEGEESEKEPVVFNPEFVQMGLSVKSGSMDIQGVKLNFYLAVVDLGKERVESFDKKMIRDLNLNRLSSDSVDGEKECLAPYAFDILLYEQALEETEKTIAEVVPGYEVVVAEPEEVLDETAGTVTGRVSRVWVTSDPKNLYEVGSILLAQMLEQEYQMAAEERVLLNPDFTLAGITVKSVPAVFGEDKVFYVHVLSIVAGYKSGVDEILNLTGVLFTDVNDNDSYDEGEAYAGGLIRVVSGNEGWSLITDAFGSFHIALTPGEYWIVNGDAQTQIGLVEKEVTLVDKDIFVLQECEPAVVTTE